MNDIRVNLRKIFDAGVKAVAPDSAVLSHLALVGDTKLKVGDKIYDLTKGRLVVAGAGKGAAPMAKAVENLLGPHISDGFVVVKDGHELPLKHLKIASASHPVPNEAGINASRKILELTSGLKPDDLLICLITGGASALTPNPVNGISLQEIQKLTNLLLASGASIDEINTIRKHLSGFSGGQLAKAANGASVLSIIVSDVIGDDLAVIASGPTAPDPTTFADCLDILKKYNLEEKTPDNIISYIKKGIQGSNPETPKPDDKIFEKVNNVLVASNRQALEACADEAIRLGYEPILIDTPYAGEAREIALKLVDMAKELSGKLKPGDKSLCLLAGGETTVTIKGSGKGGRNQEMALAAALALENIPNIYALFGGTDGSDGPTDAAGGFASSDSVQRMGGKEQASHWLDNNDSNKALLAGQELLITGPTLTNVMDLAILLIEAPQK